MKLIIRRNSRILILQFLYYVSNINGFFLSKLFRNNSLLRRKSFKEKEKD
ncbi:MAG: hypothetical protein ACKA4C_01170 [Candidatus Karelsulcia muelleri]